MNTLHPLTPFLLSLKSMGIHPMPRDYFRLHLALRGGGVWTLSQVCDVLVALMVSDPEQERRFRLQFATFFDLHAMGWQPINLELALADLRQLAERQQEPGTTTRGRIVQRPVRSATALPPSHRSRRWLWQGMVMLTLTVASAVGWYWYPVVVPIEPPVKLVDPTPPPTSVPEEPVQERDTRLRLYKDVPRVEVTPLPPDREWMAWGGGAVVLFLGLAWYTVWLWRRRRPRGEKPDLSVQQAFRPGVIGGPPAPWLERETLDYLADCLGYFRSDSRGRVMDSPASVRHTTDAGGIPTLAFAKNKQLKSVIILEDLLTESRAWNPVAGELAQGLRARGIPVVHGRFRGTPYQFHDDGSDHHLEDYGDQRQGTLLLIFSDGKGVERSARLLLEGIANWPMVAWMETREPRAWDDSTRGLALLGFSLFPATAAGLRQAIGSLLTEGGRSNAHDTPEKLLGLPLPGNLPLTEWLEQVLGDALPWAQACSRLMPPVSFGLADVLRRSGLVGTLPPQRIERLLALPHTQRTRDGFRFSSSVRQALREGYVARHAEEEREKIHEFIRGLILAAKPADTTPTLRMLSWQLRYWLFELDAVDPTWRETALEKLAKLRASVMGGAVKQELVDASPAKPDPEDREQQQKTQIIKGGPLRLPMRHMTAWLLLAIAMTASGYQAVLILPAWDFQVYREQLADKGIFIESSVRAIAAIPPAGTANSTFIRLAAFREYPGPVTDWAMLSPFSAKIIPGDETNPCHESVPDLGLTVWRCPPGAAQEKGKPVNYPTWRQQLGTSAGERLLSIGLDVRNSPIKKGEVTLSRLDQLLLETRSVDLLFVAQGDESAERRVMQRIQDDFGPLLSRSQLVAWYELPRSQLASWFDLLLSQPGKFGRTLFFYTANTANPKEHLTQLLESWKATILEEADLQAQIPTATFTGTSSLPLRLITLKKDTVTAQNSDTSKEVTAILQSPTAPNGVPEPPQSPNASIDETEISQRLDRIHELTEDQKQRIIQSWRTKEHLNLDDLKALPLQMAHILASFQTKGHSISHISLGGLKTISSEIAQILTTGQPGKYSSISLNGLEQLSSETAKAFSTWDGKSLNFNGVKTLSSETAQALALWKGESLSLEGVTTLPPEIAQALALWKGKTLNLSSVQTLSPETAQAFAIWKGKSLYLNGITTLSPETAKALALWKGTNLALGSVHILPPETAQVLATWKGKWLYLKSITTLSLETAKALALWKGIELNLSGVQNLPPETAQALALWKGKTLDLSSVQTLSPETAKALATWKGAWLFLTGVQALSTETAKAIALWKVRYLMLSGVKALSPEAAKALATWKGTKLFLEGVKILSPETVNAFNSKSPSLSVSIGGKWR